MYKLWISIEHCDADGDACSDVMESSLGGEFDTIEAAEEIYDEILCQFDNQ